MRRGGAALDLPGPLPDPLTAYLRGCPVRPPGLFRKLHKGYYGRIEALEFTVQHDDGQRPADLPKADLVLVGVSRTSNTPLSIYLAGPSWLGEQAGAAPGSRERRCAGGV